MLKDKALFVTVVLPASKAHKSQRDNPCDRPCGRRSPGTNAEVKSDNFCRWQGCLGIGAKKIGAQSSNLA